MNKWNQGRVAGVHHWNGRGFTLLIQAEIAPCQAGQFVFLALSVGPGSVSRPFSLVNPPGSSLLEIYAVVPPGGTFSAALQRVAVGDLVWVSARAYGHFVLEAIPACQTLWLLATGSGLSPYLSMISAGITQAACTVLVHAVRYREDRVYLERLEQLRAHYGGRLRLQTVVSGECVEQTLQGRIPALIASGALMEAVGCSFSSQVHVMLCGNPGMVLDAQSCLSAQFGLRKHSPRSGGQIMSERYW